MIEAFGTPLAALAVGVLLLTNLVTLGLLLGGAGWLSRLPNRDRYRARHPQSVDHQNNLRCYRCSSTLIHVDWKAFEKGVNVHSCNSCGTRLYRS
jgi:hypothetical protein